MVANALGTSCGLRISTGTRTYKWRITRIRSTPARFIGYVQAPDAEQAVKEAIARYGISNPHAQARLAAQCVKEIG
jgi:hypothetical protein